jgi:mannose-6-phosphate isomerase-like protein (cupin superfamily)
MAAPLSLERSPRPESDCGRSNRLPLARTLAGVSDPDLAFASLEPDGLERFQLLRRELGVSAFGLNLIVLEPRQRGRIHAHERQEEVYLVLEGVLTLGVEGEEHVLGSGRLVRVAAAVRRQLVNRSSQRLVVLALGGEGAHQGRDGRAWEQWSEGGEGRPPAEVALPEDLPQPDGP